MHPYHRPYFALILRLGSALCLATMFMFGKLAGEHGVALGEIMFWRQMASIPMLGGWLLLNGGLYRLKTQRMPNHFIRAMVGMTGMTFNFGAALMLHLSVATTLNFTAPLFAVLIAALVLGEKVGPWRWAAVGLGFAGVLIIAQPGSEPIPLFGGAVALLAALFNAGVSFLIRDLSRTEEPISIVFWFAVFGAVLSGMTLPFVMHGHDATTWGLLIAAGVIGTIGQILMTGALRYGAVATVIVMDYTQLLWATLFGAAIWGQFPAATVWFGAPLVIAAGIVIAWREHRLSRVAASAAIAA